MYSERFKGVSMKKVFDIKAFIVLIFSFSLFTGMPGKALAGEATDQVKQTVDAVIVILKDKELKKPEKKEQRSKKIREVIDKRFDFQEMAKRSLGIHWSKRTPEERKEFVPLYSDLLESTYIRKIERYEDEKVIYSSEKMDGAYAVVKTLIVSGKGVDIPVDYKIFKGNGKWSIYDVVVEGVSLVNNYRTQFNQIIRSESYEGLVKRLKNKVIKEP